MQFYDKLKQLRVENNFSQKSVAQKLNISNATLSQYESGVRQPSYDVLKKIADIYNVSIDYLLGRTNIKNYEEYNISTHIVNRIQQLSSEDLKVLNDFIDFLIFKSEK